MVWFEVHIEIMKGSEGSSIASFHRELLSLEKNLWKIHQRMIKGREFGYLDLREQYQITATLESHPPWDNYLNLENFCSLIHDAHFHARLVLQEIMELVKEKCFSGVTIYTYQAKVVPFQLPIQMDWPYFLSLQVQNILVFTCLKPWAKLHCTCLWVCSLSFYFFFCEITFCNTPSKTTKKGNLKPWCFWWAMISNDEEKKVLLDLIIHPSQTCASMLRWIIILWIYGEKGCGRKRKPGDTNREEDRVKFREEKLYHVSQIHIVRRDQGLIHMF